MSKVRFTIRLVESLNEELDRLAKDLGKSKNAVIIDACWQLVNDLKKFKESEM